MNSERWLEHVASRARADSPPRLEVVDAVTARVRGPRTDGLDAMAVMAGSSAAAAAILLAYAIQTLWALQDPITAMMASMNMVLR